MKKKSVILLCFFLNSLFSQLFASDWVLGAENFSLKKTDSSSESAIRAAEVLPQLILEKIASDEVRMIPRGEALDRVLYDLQTERLSLFLQLSKEIRTRDSQILIDDSNSALKKNLKASQKKIDDIKSKLQENLKKTQSEIDLAQNDIKIEKERIGKYGDESGNEKKSFPFFMPKKAGENKLTYENVVLYNNDSSFLFSPSEEAKADGYDSWTFEKNVLDAKINGLVTGSITSYGEYCSVTVELRVFPGGKTLGTTTEVGTLSDLIPLASRIAQNLDSKIANSLPVALEFSISPDDAFEKASIIIDGIVYSASDEMNESGKKIGRIEKILEGGVHHIIIESEGYESLSVNYAFTDENHFLVKAEMKKSTSALVNLRLKRFKDGIFYASGTDAYKTEKSSPYAKVSINGKNVLGVFSPVNLIESTGPKDSKNIAFFRIPVNTAFDGAYLLTNAKPYNREENIDKRRRMMYTAYSALICSLPPLFYCYGNFVSERDSHNLPTSRNNFSDVTMWRNRSYVATAVTSALGVWAIIELVRYLYAADKVLPADAKIDKNAKIILEKAQSELESVSQESVVSEGE